MRASRDTGARNPRTTRTSCCYDFTRGKTGSQQGALIVYGRSDFAVQRGMLYDHDGDGQLSDGDTVLDLTNVLMVPGSFAYQDASSTNYPFLASDIIIANSESVGLMTNGLDLKFCLSRADQRSTKCSA